MLENLNTFANLVQIASYQEIMQQANNDDLMRELYHQNKEYLEIILNNQAEIIKRLERLENVRQINENKERTS